MAGAAGRISIAISMVLMGAVGLWGSVACIPVHSDAVYLAQIDEQMRNLPIGAGMQDVPPEAIDGMRTMVQQGLQLWRELWTMPSIRFTVWLSAALNAASIIAGAGWCAGKSWAATLGMWQAVAFLPLTIWSWWPLELFLTRMRAVIMSAFSALPGIVQLSYWLDGAQAALLWTNTLMLLGWNGFLVWYFLRKQRAPAPATVRRTT